VLQKDVVAHGVDESPERFRPAQSILSAQCGKHPGKSFLAHVLNGLRGLKPGPKFHMEQFGEIANEMFLGSPVTRTEVFDVTCIECTKLQSVLRQPERT